ncbi:hypothetical protein RND71_038114 [Anisodus tanguticus]|uniref:Uncharacterized protein n=1 Tax=Anisodus tanguticus TaxID=243964 RepID=A0AAE1QZC6_9SOLA|nr:hypothetical protein RND71_038114 [Anisodus tanguticus]
MEVLAITEFPSDCNKENIPPSYSEKFPPHSLKLKFCSRNVKRKFRRPLRDITHLFNSPVKLNSAVFTRLQGSVYLSSQAIVRGKRRVVDENIDSLQKHSSKILRRDFR